MAGIQRREEARGVRWVVRYRTPDGRARSESFPTQREAKQRAAAVEAQKAAGSFVDPKAARITFGEVAEQWHAGRVGLARTTLAQHRSYMDSLILPAFGQVPLAAITADGIRGWIRTLDEDGKAPATIGKAVALLRAILRQAVEDQRLARSPADVRLELPKAEHRPMVVLTAEQVMDLAEAAGGFYRTHLLTAAQTGLRWGELAGLPLSAVDPLHGEVQVQQQLTEVAGSLQITSQLKTATSRRTITISRELGDLLGQHAGRFPNQHDLMFTTLNGKQMRRGNFGRSVLRPAAEAIGVPGLRFHDLRHTHASLLLATGEPVTQVSKRLGHQDALTTMRIYAHAIPGTERSAADRMGEMFGSVPSLDHSLRGRDGGEEPPAPVAHLPGGQ